MYSYMQEFYPSIFIGHRRRSTSITRSTEKLALIKRIKALLLDTSEPPLVSMRGEGAFK